MEINMYEFDVLFRRKHAYLTLATDHDLGKREKADYWEKYKTTQREIAFLMLSKRPSVIKVKGGEFYV